MTPTDDAVGPHLAGGIGGLYAGLLIAEGVGPAPSNRQWVV